VRRVRGSGGRHVMAQSPPGSGRPGSGRSALLLIILCTVATGSGALLYLDFYDSPRHLTILCAGSVVGSATGWVVGWRRWSAVPALGATFLVYLVLVAAAWAVDAAHAGSTLDPRGIAAEVGWSIAGGWAEMLSSAVPVDVTVETVTAPLLVLFFAAAGSSCLCLRGRAVLAPVGVAAAAFCANLVLVGRSASDTWLPTGLLLTASLLLVLVRSGQRLLRDRVASLLALLAVLAVGMFAGQAHVVASGEDRADPRSLVEPPLHIEDVANPLSLVKAQLSLDPPRPLFTVQAPGASTASTEVDRITLVALEEYDGALWTSRARYLPAGRRLPRDRGLSNPTSIRARFTVDELDGPFLPTIGWPREVELPVSRPERLGFSQTTGTLATDAPDTGGLSYEVVGEFRVHDDQIVTAAVGTSDRFEPLRTVPPTPPPAMSVLLHRVTEGHDTPYRKLKAIEEYLRLLPYDLEARAGQSYFAINRFLGPRRDGEGSGHAEQHAAAFAIWSRMLGYPSRIAVGYLLPGPLDGSYQVTTAHAHAWPEVYFEDHGWVAFEPTDMSRHGVPPPSLPAAPPRPTPNPEPTPGPTSSLPPAEPGKVFMAEPEPFWPVAALIAASAAAAGFLIVLLVAAVKLLRRTVRRRLGTDSARIAGAWAEAIDRLREQRAVVTLAMTPVEVAETTAVKGSSVPSGQRWPALGSLAQAVTAAIFQDRPATRGEALHAWQLEYAVRRSVYPRRASARRLLALIDPAPLSMAWKDRRMRKRTSRRSR